MGKSERKVEFFDLFENKTEVFKNNTELEEITSILVKGGWPDYFYLDEKEAIEMNREYLNQLIVPKINQKSLQYDKERMFALLKCLARKVTSLINVSKLSIESEIYERTLEPRTTRKYLDILSRMFIISELRSFKFSLQSSLEVKSKPKIYFVDPALVCAILNYNTKKLLLEPQTNGILFESFVYKELQSYCEASGFKMSYYNDTDDLEIDFIIEDFDGNCIAIEVKLGSEKGIEEGIKNIKRFKNKISEADRKRFKSYNIVTACSNSYITPEGINIFPINFLFIDINKLD
jgi:predicted AAA+ superfamily ATPase